jgi:hypothetical protein
MTVFPRKTAAISKVYPPTKAAEDTIEVIGLPEFIYWPFDKIRDVWKDLTTFGERKKEAERPPKEVPAELSYERGIEVPELPAGYKVFGDGGGAKDAYKKALRVYSRLDRKEIDAFYRSMERAYGVPIRGIPYKMMEELVPDSGKHDFVAGLHMPKRKRIYISEDFTCSDGRHELLSKPEIQAATCHELGHATGRTSNEPKAHKRGKQIARKHGLNDAFSVLVKMEMENPHLREYEMAA